VAIHPPPGGDAPTETLRDRMLLGLGGLLAAARRRVDRRLDGAPVGSMRGP
jgi:hypothetical protein